MRKAKVVWHKDDDAVSPVIGTILMVAITVVLAAVLGLTVSGMIQDPEDEKLTIQLSSPTVTKYDRNGDCWDAVLNVNKMTPKDEKVQWSEVKIAIKDSGGSILNQATEPDLDISTYMDPAAVEFWYVDISVDVPAKMGAGDSIKLSGLSDLYEGATVQILKAGKIIGSTTLPTDFP
jgi:flagellin-like protein